MKKTLSKSNKANMLSTYYGIYVNCGTCGICGCTSCTEVWVSQSWTGDAWIVEAEYRNAIGTHT